MTLYSVFQTGAAFLRVVQIAIFIYALLSWFARETTVFRWLEAFISPFIAPFRRLGLWVSDRFHLPFDLTCWFALIGLEVVEQVWWLIYRILRLLK